MYRRVSSDVNFAQSSYTLSLIHACLKQTRARFAVADAREHVRDRAGLAVVERCVRAIETEVAHTSSSDCEISFSEPAIYEIDGGNLFTGNCDTIRPAQLVPN